MKLSMNDVYDFIDYRMDVNKYVELLNIDKVKKIVDDNVTSEKCIFVDEYVRAFIANEIYSLLVEYPDRIRDLINFEV